MSEAVSFAVPRQDVTAMLNLVAQTAELPPDPIVRRRCLLAGLCRIMKAAVGLAYTCSFETAAQHLRIISAVQIGLSKELQPLLEDYFATGLPPDPQRHALIAETQTVSTWRRCELVDDETWYASAHFTALRQPLGLADSICTARRLQLGPASFCILELCRGTDQPSFTETDRWMVHAVWQSGCRLHTVCGKAGGNSPVPPLPPRLQTVLPLLAEGHSEKQIARQLDLSRHTVHSYIKLIYKSLGVTTRAELASKWAGVRHGDVLNVAECDRLCPPSDAKCLGAAGLTTETI